MFPIYRVLTSKVDPAPDAVDLGSETVPGSGTHTYLRLDRFPAPIQVVLVRVLWERCRFDVQTLKATEVLYLDTIQLEGFTGGAVKMLMIPTGMLGAPVHGLN